MYFIERPAILAVLVVCSGSGLVPDLD